MIEQVDFKPDLAQAIARFDAWWLGEMLDRPPLSFGVKPARHYRGPNPPTSMEDHWLNVELVVARAAANLEHRDYLAETLPIFAPNLGSEITASLWGCDLRFSESTSWSEPLIHDPAQRDATVSSERPLSRPHDQYSLAIVVPLIA